MQVFFFERKRDNILYVVRPLVQILNDPIANVGLSLLQSHFDEALRGKTNRKTPHADLPTEEGMLAAAAMLESEEGNLIAAQIAKSLKARIIFAC